MALAPTARFWLAVRARTDLAIVSTDFVAAGGRPGHERLFKIHGQPIAGRPATMRVTMSSAPKNPSFRLVAVDGHSLESIELSPASDDEFVGSFRLPAEPFRVLVTGVDEAELRFQRMSPVLFRGEALEVIPSTNDDEVSAGETAAVTFTVRNFGTADHFRFMDREAAVDATLADARGIIDRQRS